MVTSVVSARLQLGVGGRAIGPGPVIGMVHEEDVGGPLAETGKLEAALGVGLGLSPDVRETPATLAGQA